MSTVKKKKIKKGSPKDPLHELLIKMSKLFDEKHEHKNLDPQELFLKKALFIGKIAQIVDKHDKEH